MSDVSMYIADYQNIAKVIKKKTYPKDSGSNRP